VDILFAKTKITRLQQKRKRKGKSADAHQDEGKRERTVQDAYDDHFAS
jgi:hypothetical protein